MMADFVEKVAEPFTAPKNEQRFCALMRQEDSWLRAPFSAGVTTTPVLSRLGLFQQNRREADLSPLDFVGTGNLRRGMEGPEHEAIYDELIAIFEKVVDMCIVLGREERLVELERTCRRAAALSARLLALS